MMTVPDKSLKNVIFAGGHMKFLAVRAINIKVR